MAFRVEKRISALVTGLLLLGSALSFGQAAFRYEAEYSRASVRHREINGTLIITDSGVSFDETYRAGKRPRHSIKWNWLYRDIEQLTVAPASLTVLTYRDNKWKLGADRSYRFQIASDETFEGACAMLKARLDQRFVAEIADRIPNVLWEIPVKRLLPFGGDTGILQIGDNEIVYEAVGEAQSRSWRYQDIENISSSGPFELTITTFERARMHYGDRKAFNFELKQQLEEARYNDLWLRLNQSKGLRVLDAYRQQ